MIVLDFWITQPFKGSKLANIEPKFKNYSAFDRKKLAKLYSAICVTMGSQTYILMSKTRFFKPTYNP